MLRELLRHPCLAVKAVDTASIVIGVVDGYNVAAGQEVERLGAAAHVNGAGLD